MSELKVKMKSIYEQDKSFEEQIKKRKHGRIELNGFVSGWKLEIDYYEQLVQNFVARKSCLNSDFYAVWC
nr:hypothetical protein [Tanacetum cinerariifolium]